MSNPTCPFCGVEINITKESVFFEHIERPCPLSGYAFKISEWNMRPAKQEQTYNQQLEDITIRMNTNNTLLRRILDEVRIKNVSIKHT